MKNFNTLLLKLGGVEIKMIHHLVALLTSSFDWLLDLEMSICYILRKCLPFDQMSAFFYLWGMFCSRLYGTRDRNYTVLIFALWLYSLQVLTQ